MVCQLPGLSDLWIVIQGRTLEGFRGATLEKLKMVHFHTESEQIGDFLGVLESVALTTSIQNPLSLFVFHTSRTRNPVYSSLLRFTRLRHRDRLLL